MKIRRKLGSTLSASKLAGSPRNFIFRTLLRAELFFKFGQRRWWLGVAVEVARAACGGGNCFRSWALSSRFNPNSVPPPNTHFTHPLQCHWPVQDDQANFLPDFNKFGSPTSPPLPSKPVLYCYFVPDPNWDRGSLRSVGRYSIRENWKNTRIWFLLIFAKWRKKNLLI